MAQFAMLEGASGRGRTERVSLQKISILISAEGSTVERGLSSPGCDRFGSVQGPGSTLFDGYLTDARPITPPNAKFPANSRVFPSGFI
jgi:hypothetical protein